MSNRTLQSLSSIFNRVLINRLLIPVIIATLLVLGGASFFGGQLAGMQQQMISRSVSFAATNFLMHAANELDMMAYEYSKAGIPGIVLSMEADLNSHNLFDTFYLLDKEGFVEAIVPEDTRYMGLDMSGQTYFYETDCSKGINYFPPFTSLRTNQPTAFISRCTDDRKIIVGELNLMALQEAITVDQNDVSFGQSYVIVVD